MRQEAKRKMEWEIQVLALTSFPLTHLLSTHAQSRVQSIL